MQIIKAALKAAFFICECIGPVMVAGASVAQQGFWKN